MRERRRSRARWLVLAAFLFAITGPAVYMIWDTTVLWWLAPLTAVPLYFLIEDSGRKRRRNDGLHFGTGDAAPWTPPDGL